MRLRFDRYSDETITTSLIYLRAQIIREGRPGQDHVDALLRLRGVDLDGLRVPPVNKRTFAKGELTKAVLAALRDGPRTAPQLYDAIQPLAPDMPRRALSERVRTCLKRMEGRGVVRREGRVWMSY